VSASVRLSADLHRTVQMKVRTTMPKTPTRRTYEGFDAANEYFNKQLFAGRLPACVITARPRRGAYGYLSGERFGSRDGNQIHEEFALSIRRFQPRRPRYFGDAGARNGTPVAASFGRAIAQRLPQQGTGAAHGTRRLHAFGYRGARRQANRAAGIALIPDGSSRIRPRGQRCLYRRIGPGRARECLG
jgi:hypothetical protein